MAMKFYDKHGWVDIQDENGNTIQLFMIGTEGEQIEVTCPHFREIYNRNKDGGLHDRWAKSILDNNSFDPTKRYL